MKRFFLFLFFVHSVFAKCVLVVGGAGFIGSHVNECLHRNGYDTVILDNLSQGRREAVRHGILIEGEMSDPALLDQIFTQYSIDAVMHFAAFLNVGESVAEPLKYYQNNVAGTLTLLEAMKKQGVNVFIFSSSASVFGLTEGSGIAEDYPCHPINPYGNSKLIVEEVLQDCHGAYGLQFTALRYFNAAGGDPAGMIKTYKKPANLIPIVLDKIKTKGVLTIFGTDYETSDGTCIRDYIHVEDLASAHVAAMERLFEGGPSTVYNLGTGWGYSVREVIAAAEKVTGQKVSVIEGARRPGDPAIVVADASKAQKQLGWKPQYSSLEMMILHAWQSLP